MIVTLKRYCPVGRNYVTRSIGLTPLPMSMSSPTVRATPRDALRGVALSSVSMRPPTASHRADLLPLTPRRATPLGTWHQGACQTAAGPRCGHLSVPIPLGRRPQMPRRWAWWCTRAAAGQVPAPTLAASAARTASRLSSEFVQDFAHDRI
jgi:hypothetical protein